MFGEYVIMDCDFNDGADKHDNKRRRIEINTEPDKFDEEPKTEPIVNEPKRSGFSRPIIHSKHTSSKHEKIKKEIVKPVIKCKNPLCDHKSYDDDSSEVTKSTLESINSLNDLVALGYTYHCKKNKTYAGINLKILCNLISPMTDMINMVGMNDVKNQMVDQILFFAQGHNIVQKCGKCHNCSIKLKCDLENNDMMHTVITGPPGVGKTELGKILGKLYKEMGILTKGTFKTVSRSDLIGEYLGSTALKTQKVIDEATGGVLFIDEAYSLGNKELRDSFSKECIDTLNRNLTERRDFLCIIAGYEKEIEECFFKFNAGLKRRFTFKYDVKPYNYKEMLLIFERKVQMSQWKLYYNENDIVDQVGRERTELMFKKNMGKFKNYGGDMETLLFNCKISHSRRCVFGDNINRKVITYNDLENGLKSFVINRKHKFDDDDDYDSNGKSVYG